MSPLAVQLVVSLLAASAPAAPPGAGTDAPIVVLAVGDPPRGPPAEVSEATHRMRRAIQDRAGGTLDASTLRARLSPSGAPARLVELERAYVGAQATFQADEIDSALRAFRAIVADLERLPEGGEAYSLWLRAHLRIALAERTLEHPREMAAAMERILAVEPGLVVDAEQYAPSFRSDFDEARRRVVSSARLALTLRSSRAVTAYLDGKDLGSPPVTLLLPPGTYRVGGTAGAVRLPEIVVTLRDEGAEVDLDLELADAARPAAGPGFALDAGARRTSGLLRAGRWLGAARLVAVSEVVEGRDRYLQGSLFDVRREALVREARIRVGAASPRFLVDPAVPGEPSPGEPSPGEPVPGEPPGGVDALAAFLLTGKSSALLTVTVPPPPLVPPAPAGRPARWLRPAAYVAGALALGLGALSATQALASRDGFRDAAAMVRPDGALVAGADRAGYEARIAGAEASGRNAYVSAVSAVVLGAAAGVLGYLSWDARGVPSVRF